MCAHIYNTYYICIHTYIEYLQINIPITKKIKPQRSCCGRDILKAKAPKFTNTLYYNKFMV